MNYRKESVDRIPEEETIQIKNDSKVRTKDHIEKIARLNKSHQLRNSMTSSRIHKEITMAEKCIISDEA